MSSVEDNDLDFAAYREAQLGSEQARIIGLLLVFSFFFAIGIFRIVVPLMGSVRPGVAIVGLTLVYLVLEVRMFARVKHARSSGIDIGLFEHIAHGIVECLYPVIGMALLIGFAGVDPFILLLSPGYAFIILLLALSILRLDLREVLATGIVSTLGYGCLVAYVFLTRDVTVTGPAPPAMYVNQILLLLIATGAIAFITVQVRRYVLAAVREMETRRELDVMQRDLEVASEIQRGLLPATMPDLAGYELAAFSRPAAQAGGDYYDWQTVSDNRFLVSLADVAGHGVGPALVTATCRAYVRASTDHFTSPNALLERVNKLIHSDVTGGRFVTFALLDLDLRGHRANLLAAGHASTLFLTAGNERPNAIAAQGLPLGIAPDPMLDDVYSLSFSVGDLLLMFSDGVHELSNVAGESYGLVRLGKFVSANRARPAQQFIAQLEMELDAFRGPSMPQDDMTVIVIQRRD